MSQGALTIADSDGATFLSNLNAAHARLAGKASGTARPADIATYETWVDTDTPSSSVNAVYMWDGTADVLQGYLDTTNHVVIPPNDVQAADVASATTTDIGAARGRCVKITGTTTITGLGTVQAGTAKVVEFTGVLTLTHDGTALILPGAANITTAAGDSALFVSRGSGNWKCAIYQRASGAPIASDYSVLPRLLATLTASGSSSLVYTAMSVSYKSYEFRFINLVPATNNVGFQAQLSADAGATWQATNYITTGSGLTTAMDLSSGTNQTNTLGFGGLSGRAVLFQPYTTTFNKNVFFDAQGNESSSGTQWRIAQSTQWQVQATAINAIKFFFSSGNIASGYVEVWGIP